MAKRISIINFKGGVGKTTFAFNLGAGLARFHDATVLLVDMDHQSSLSIVCLGRREWEGCSDHTVDGIFEHFPAPNLPGSDIIHASSFGAHDSYENVHVVPAKLELDNTEIKLTASHSGNAIQSEWDKRTLMCRWIEEAGVDELYDYILFDCAPATKIVSQNAIAASHGYIVPVVPEAVMVRGVPHLYPNVAINVVCHAAFSRYFKDLMVGIAVLFNLTCGESERQSKIDTRSCEIGDLPTIG